MAIQYANYIAFGIYIICFILVMRLYRKVKRTLAPLKNLKKAYLEPDTNKVILPTITFNEDQWMRVDDVLFWLKENQRQDPEHTAHYHFMIRSFVKLKNQKVDG